MRTLETKLVEYGIDPIEVEQLANSTDRRKTPYLTMQVAHDFEAISPDDAALDEDGNLVHKDGYLYKSLRLYPIAPVLYEICKELAKELEELRGYAAL